MVWDETSDPAVVVMLTQAYESGREKCFPYYPEDGSNPVVELNEEDEFGDGFKLTMTLKEITQDLETESVIRQIELRDPSGRTKTVWHFLYSAWPDFLVPEGDDRTALLRLLRLSQSKNTAVQSTQESGPRIVHCSAGVGRTGTFIALDWLLAEMEKGVFDNLAPQDDPIPELIDRLRQQRMMMVQGEQQFMFLYDIMRERWQERWLRLNSTPVATS
jgi:protein-tyrosine phosphatase